MKRLILIPLLLISAFCFSQTIDTLLGSKGKLIKDTSLTIDGNYLFTPSRNHLSFDSSKLGWILNGNKLYTKFQQVGIGTINPRAKLMVSDSIGSVSNNDSSGVFLTNDTTGFSPSLTFNAKAVNSSTGVWQKAGYRLYSNTITGNLPSAILHLQYATNSGSYADVVTFTQNAITCGAITSSGSSTFATAISVPQVNGVTAINLGNFSAGYGITQTTSYGGFTNGGGFNIAPAISQTGAGTFRGIYFNPTLTNYPNVTLTGYENPVGQNLLNSTSDNTGVGVTTIDHSAKFQVGGTSQGVLFPVMTQSQRDSLARPVTSVTINSGGSGITSTTTGQAIFSAGAIRAKGQFTASGGAITSVSITEPGAYGAGQTPVTVTFSGAFTGSASATVNLGASAPAIGLTVFCSNCTATDSSTGVYQTWNGSTWKNWW